MAVDVGAFDFEKVIGFMQGAGFFDYLIPLLLIFSIMFALLEKTKVLGKNKTNINVLVALVIGLLLVAQPLVVQTMNSFLPKASLIFIVILVCLMTIALLAGGEHTGIAGTAYAIAAIVVIIAILSALGASVPGAESFLSSDEASSLLTWAIPLGIFFLTIYLLTRPSGGRRGYGLNNFARNLRGESDFEAAARQEPPAGGQRG